MLKSIYVILRVNDRGHFNIPVSRVGHYLVFIVLSISTAGSQHKHLDTRAVFMCFLYHRTLAGYTLQHITQLPLLFHIIKLCRRKEGNVLFNDALNTFYLRLYGVRHMVKDHSDNERGNLLPPHRLFFLISIKGYFICIIPQTG